MGGGLRPKGEVLTVFDFDEQAYVEGYCVSIWWMVPIILAIFAGCFLLGLLLQL